jgi:pimeloyl-ACP methyl ester carboxylesterase
MGSAEIFRPLLAQFPEDQHVIALDLPGSGSSERRAGLAVTMPAMAGFAQRAIQQLGLKRPALVGHSHGGAIALQLAQSCPAQVGLLVLLAPAHPYFQEGEPLIRFYLSLPGRLFALAMPWAPQWMQMIWLRRMAGPRASDTVIQLRPYRENLRTAGTVQHLLKLLRSWGGDMSDLGRLLRRRVVHPSLIVWGDCDRAVPLQSCEALRAHFDFSELRVLPHVGHRLAEEQPDVVASLIVEFLGRIETWGWRYSPKEAVSQSRRASLMAPSFDSGD